MTVLKALLAYALKAGVVAFLGYNFMSLSSKETAMFALATFGIFLFTDQLLFRFVGNFVTVPSTDTTAPAAPTTSSLLTLPAVPDYTGSFAGQTLPGYPRSQQERLNLLNQSLAARGLPPAYSGQVQTQLPGYSAPQPQFPGYSAPQPQVNPGGAVSPQVPSYPPGATHVIMQLPGSPQSQFATNQTQSSGQAGAGPNERQFGKPYEL